MFKEMRGLRAGDRTYREIAVFLGIDYSTVVYHLDEGQRMKALDRARESIARRNGKRVKTESEKEYDVEYYRDRYSKDREFRMKVIRANSSGGHFKEEED